MDDSSSDLVHEVVHDQSTKIVSPIPVTPGYGNIQSVVVFVDLSLWTVRCLSLTSDPEVRAESHQALLDTAPSPSRLPNRLPSALGVAYAIGERLYGSLVFDIRTSIG